MMSSFIAISQRPAGMDPAGLRRALEEMARQGRELGVRPKETLVAKDGSEVVTFLEAGDASDVLRLHELAGLPAPRVREADRIYTELLSEPHRAH